MSTDAAHIHQEVKRYVLVFVALLFLTMVTVTVSYLHLPLVPAIAVALDIATVKGGLVACYFMHLISERKLVYFVLSFTVVFFIALLFLPLGNHHDFIRGSEYVP